MYIYTYTTHIYNSKQDGDDDNEDDHANDDDLALDSDITSVLHDLPSIMANTGNIYIQYITNIYIYIHIQYILNINKGFISS